MASLCFSLPQVSSSSVSDGSSVSLDADVASLLLVPYPDEVEDPAAALPLLLQLAERVGPSGFQTASQLLDSFDSLAKGGGRARLADAAAHSSAVAQATLLAASRLSTALMQDALPGTPPVVVSVRAARLC